MSDDDGLEGSIVSEIGVDINGFVSTEGERCPEYFFLSFWSDTDGDNFFDCFFGFKIGSLLHGDFAEGVDIHSGVGEVNGVVFDFDFLWGVVDDTFDSDKNFHKGDL